MLTPIIVFGLASIAAVAIIVSFYWLLGLLGESDRAHHAGIQAMRWFLAGAVIASIDDVLSSGTPTAMMIPGALSLVILMWAEYVIKGTEEKVTDGATRAR